MDVCGHGEGEVSHSEHEAYAKNHCYCLFMISYLPLLLKFLQQDNYLHPQCIFTESGSIYVIAEAVICV